MNLKKVNNKILYNLVYSYFKCYRYLFVKIQRQRILSVLQSITMV